MGIRLSSANSINWGRLVPQVAYYFSAYCDMANAGAVKFGDEINIAVPTGNFGNILAAYFAKQMGVPEVAASPLYDRQFYAKIRNRFINTYFSISKLNKLNANFMESIKTPKDAVDGFLGLMLAKSEKGVQEIDSYLEELKANQVFADRINYKRTEDALYKAASKAKLSSKDELVAELDDCFINLKANG